MDIYYGLEGDYRLLNEVILEKEGSSFFIPKDEHQRSLLFGDHALGKKKDIILSFDDSLCVVNHDIKINKIEYKINKSLTNPIEIIEDIHKNICILGGNIKDEYPEQLLAVKYIEPDDKVLEIGSNIGRNSCVISSILNDSSNLVTLETLKSAYHTCLLNKKINNCKFNIENKALSYVPLQQKEWSTIPIIDNVIIDGYVQVETITYEDLLAKYNIDFNVLVLDCEGAIYHILKSNPSILTNINKIIIENDFIHPEHFEYVQSLFFEYGFKVFYSGKLELNINEFSYCKYFFYQVYIK